MSTTLSGRSEAVALFALSVMTMRRSKWPSGTGVVSQSAVYGAGPVVSVPIVVQVPAPAGEYWNATDLMPEPSGAGLASRVTVPRR